MDEGKKGCSLYDWWEINLVKNVNPEKRDYANQIPKNYWNEQFDLQQISVI